MRIRKQGSGERRRKGENLPVHQELARVCELQSCEIVGPRSPAWKDKKHPNAAIKRLQNLIIWIEHAFYCQSDI